MTEIPDDVLKTAQEAYTSVRIEHPVGTWTTEQVKEVAKRAVLAERERCCKVAAHFTGSLWTSEQNIAAQMILDNLRDGRND